MGVVVFRGDELAGRSMLPRSPCMEQLAAHRSTWSPLHSKVGENTLPGLLCQ